MSREDKLKDLQRASSGYLSRKVHDNQVDIWLKSTSGNYISILDDNLDFDEIIEPLGAGLQGKVYPVTVLFQDATNAFEERPCVLKISPKKKKQMSPVANSMHSELTRLTDTSTDVNVIKEIAHFEDPRLGDLTLLPYCPFFLSDFQKYLSGINKSDSLFLIAALHITLDLLNALTFMHEQRIVHRDIKLDNVGFYRGHWCLIDLDSAASMDSTESTTSYGTLAFMHPACFHPGANRTLRAENDIYAVGTILKILLGEINTKDFARENSRDFMKRKEREYLALGKEDIKMGVHKGKAHLSRVSDPGVPLLEKLKGLADAMTVTCMSHQPKIADLLGFTMKSMDELKQSFDEESLSEQLNNLYSSFESNGFDKSSESFIGSTPESPVSSLQRSAREAHRLSIFSAGASLSINSLSGRSIAIEDVNDDEEQSALK